ncbi:hypothetical protein PI125_g12389 [Phytophthora idaei]|nr:hypothetical protein PI125_g12389 [Phytophthora idaei]
MHQPKKVVASSVLFVLLELLQKHSKPVIYMDILQYGSTGSQERHVK